jgi:hypothetical protein
MAQKIGNIAAIPTRYAGVNFRSRLEARWAAFFDLAGWKWKYEPIDLVGWIPDFWVSFACTNSDCERVDGRRDGSHELLVEVKPYLLDWRQSPPPEFDGHPAAKWVNDFTGPTCPLPYDGVALFGLDPQNTTWCMPHGGGGGQSSVSNWVDEADTLWREAGNEVQWRASRTA